VPRLSGDTYGIGRSTEQAKVQQAAFKGCMAEKGIRIEWVQDAGPTETAGET
jgi:ABC-type nitrate/sulfonate/bicarbonate transport system substrate-binding protein